MLIQVSFQRRKKLKRAVEGNRHPAGVNKLKTETNAVGAAGFVASTINGGNGNLTGFKRRTVKPRNEGGLVKGVIVPFGAMTAAQEDIFRC